MQIYNYDTSGVYIGAHTLDDSDRDPLNPSEFLIPADCTTVAPPPMLENDGALWGGSEWQIKPDYRGTKYWLNDVEHVMTELGDLPTGARIHKPTTVLAQELETAKKSALSQIEAKADAYQIRFLEANSSQREGRFAQNLLAAKRLIANQYTDDSTDQFLKLADNTSIRLQAEQKSMTTEDFAKWIVEWEPKIVLIAGTVEAFLVKSRLALQHLTSIEQIEPFLSEIATQAEAKFAELTR